MKNIGDTLKKLREENGMTRKEAADKLKDLGIDISDKTLYGYESGRNSANADMFLALCKIYKCNNIMGTFSETIEDILFTNNEWNIIEKYRSLDPLGQSHVDTLLDWELARSGQLRQSQSENEALKLQLSHERTVSRFFAYYGRVAAAGTSVELSDIAAGVRAYRENEINKQADYVIGVNGDSMEPEYFDGDIVYVQKTDHIEIGDIGIFQRGNSIYIKKVGENGLISLNPDYPPLMADGDRIMVLGKVLGKAEEI